MAAASDFLERIYYRLVFEAGFGDAVINTDDLDVVLYNTIPNEAQDNAFVELVDPLVTGINEILAPGYNAVPVDDPSSGGGPNFEISGSGDTGLWVNTNNLVFGTATGTWTVRGWGIKNRVTGDILMYGTFIEGGAPAPDFTVPPGENFVVPSGSFQVTID